jgi:hypothetical protein
MVEVLSRAAASDPSPVLRFAAIEALGRFQDERAVGAILSAYQTADGLPRPSGPGRGPGRGRRWSRSAGRAPAGCRPAPGWTSAC